MIKVLNNITKKPPKSAMKTGKRSKQPTRPPVKPTERLGNKSDFNNPPKGGRRRTRRKKRRRIRKKRRKKRRKSRKKHKSSYIL